MELPRPVEASIEFSSIMLAAGKLCLADIFQWGCTKVDDAMDVWTDEC